MLRRILICLFCVVMCVTMLSACSDKNKFEMQDGKYINKKNNIAYTDAPACYSPVKMGSEPYGELEGIQLYPIEGADPELWLSEATGIVFYADGVKLPTLAEMQISEARIMVDTATSVALSEQTYLGIIDAYTNAEGVAKPEVTEDMLSLSVELRFTDGTLGICYSLIYIELNEDYILGDENYGKRFVFNRFSDRCVTVDAVLDEYLEEHRT